MGKSQNYRFYLGSVGWEHAEWNGSFYPDDLPPEWRLAYYNTAYSSVYLAYAEWSGYDLKTLASWVEDTAERFRFILEPNPAGCSDDDQARLEVLAPRIGFVPGDSGWPDAPQGDSDPLHTTPHGSVLRPIADRSAAYGRGKPRAESYGCLVWLEGEPDLKTLAIELEKLATSPVPVYLISRDHRLDVMNRVKTLLEVMGI